MLYSCFLRLSNLHMVSDASGKESACQFRRCKRHRFYPWVGIIPWSRKWHPSPVFLIEKFHGQRNLVDSSPWGHKELEWLSDWAHKHTVYLFMLVLLSQFVIPPNPLCPVLYFCIFILCRKKFLIRGKWAGLSNAHGKLYYTVLKKYIQNIILKCRVVFCGVKNCRLI